MAHVVIMPKLGLTMTNGKISKWLKKEGDAVCLGEPLVEIETDKINSEVESPADGFILKLLAQEGEEKDITVPICIVGQKDEVIKSEGWQADEIKISPIARKIAEENGVDYKQVKGTGPNGRIVKEDIISFIETHKESTSIPTAVNIPVAIMGKMVSLAGVRRVIAQRLSQSKHDIPHAYFKISVDVGRIIELKSKITDIIKTRSGKKLSLNDIIVKAVAVALEFYNDINVSLVNNEIIYHDDINIGIAVNSDRGLVVPVIKNANSKSLADICRCSAELIDRAKAGKLAPDDVSGGTFTISNLGVYHLDEFSAIINPPESAILAVGMAKQTPCVENGQIVIKNIMSMTISVDHRVIDGALAAQFMKKLKDIIEDSYALLV